MSDKIPEPEFPRPLYLSRISPNGTDQSLEAKPDERAALAKRFDLLELKSLKGDLSITPKGAQTIAVTGKLTAEYVQPCVVTLDPITTRLNIDIAVTFIPAERVQDEDDDFVDDGDEELETHDGHKIDLGELLAQQLGININPYPRKKGAALPATEFGPQADKPHPFANLKEVVKNKDKTKD